VASESARQPLSVSLARAIAGGALVSLLSFLLVSVDSDGSRLSLAYIIGALLALGPFGHAVVTVLHLFLGVLFDAGITATRFVTVVSVVTAGNFVGGLGLVTFAHVMQAIGTEREGSFPLIITGFVGNNFLCWVSDVWLQQWKRNPFETTRQH